METAEEICGALQVAVLGRQRVIVLLKHAEKASAAAERFRAWLTEAKLENLLRPVATNPDFVKLSNGAWVFFVGCEELAPEDEVGQADFVLWPTEGGIYEQFRYRDWRDARAGQPSPWRPVVVVSEEEPAVTGERTIWDRLCGEDDIG